MQHETAKLLKKSKQYPAENLTRAMYIITEEYGSVSHASYVTGVPWQTINVRIGRQYSKDVHGPAPLLQKCEGYLKELLELMASFGYGPV